MEKKIIIKNGKINWVCLYDKCKSNCCGSFKDRNKIYNQLFSSCFNVGHEAIFLTPKDKRNLKRNKKAGFIEINKNDSTYLKLNKNGSCPFLKKGLCSIYKVRPQLCRAYPFYIDAGSGLNIDVFCPGIGKGWTDIKEIKDYMNAVAKLYKSQIKASQKFIKKQK